MKKLYIKVTLIQDGRHEGSFVEPQSRVRGEDLAALLNDSGEPQESPDAFLLEQVWLTDEEYAALPEFIGF